MKAAYAVPLTVALAWTGLACNRRPDARPQAAQATPETRVEIVTMPIPGYPADLWQLGQRSVARITVGDEVREVPLADHQSARGLRRPVGIDGVTFRRASGRLIVAWRVTKDSADPYAHSPIQTEVHVASIDGNQAVHCVLAAAEGVRRSGAHVMPEPPWGAFVSEPRIEADGRRVVITAETRQVPGGPATETHRFVSRDGGLAWVSGEQRIVAVALPPARRDWPPVDIGPEPFPDPGDPHWPDRPFPRPGDPHWPDRPFLRPGDPHRRDPRLPHHHEEPELKTEAVAGAGGRMQPAPGQPVQ